MISERCRANDPERPTPSQVFFSNNKNTSPWTGQAKDDDQIWSVWRAGRKSIGRRITPKPPINQPLYGPIAWKYFLDSISNQLPTSSILLQTMQDPVFVILLLDTNDKTKTCNRSPRLSHVSTCLGAKYKHEQPIENQGQKGRNSQMVKKRFFAVCVGDKASKSPRTSSYSLSLEF